MKQPLLPHNLAAAARAIRILDVDDQTSDAEAIDGVRILTNLNGCWVGVVRFVGETPWEIHEQDELLHVLEGQVELTVLYEVESARTMASAGEVIVVPRACWHRQHAREPVTLMFITSTESNATSRSEDPRK